MRICERCNNPVFGTDKKTRIGYCKSHQYLRTDLDKRSIVQKAMDKAKKEPKRKAGWFDAERVDLSNVQDEAPKWEKPKGNNELQRWFEQIRPLMTGKCKHCGGKSCKDDSNKFHFSICHIFPKAYFKSVATHPDNWIELCFWNNNCHGNMDNKTLDLIEMNCFDEIVEKATKIYPHIAKEERRRIPAILLEYIKTEL